MSRKLESSGAALAALCIVGVSSQANATTISISDITHDQLHRTDIAIDSSTAQFYYDSFITSPLGSYPGGDVKANFGAYGSAGIFTPGQSTPDPALAYSGGSTTVYKSGSTALTGYVNLAFTNGAAQQEYAVATFSNGDLISIGDVTTVTESVSSTPLPASWALLVSGSAVFGLIATRRRRRRELVA